ncbi:serine proteinase [Agrocybe pediades]|nr:serine proteinase [Agrocybe pediades]
MSGTTAPTDQPPFVAIETVEGEKTGRHIVLLHDTVDQAQVVSGIRNINSPQPGRGVTHQYHAINGFAGFFDDATLAALQTNPGVLAIVEDSIMYTCMVSGHEPWGLGRVSSEHRISPADTYTSSEMVYSYSYDAQAGSGVDIYVLDTGVRVTHKDFDGRATWSGVFITKPDDDTDSKEVDANGHGTHCAATAIGTKFGVAKLANVLAVKVLNHKGKGSASDIIAGMNHVLDEASNSGRPSVVSMSLGGPGNRALDDAARKLVRHGIHVVVAAGNQNEDSINRSPARGLEVITVGASTILDERADFSNFGHLVNIFAPGVHITSASNKSDTGTAVKSGTSMATPHVSGMVAYVISIYGNAAPLIMAHTLRDIAWKGVLNPYTLPCGTPNLLLGNKTAL